MAYGSIILALALAACLYALSFLRAGRGPPTIPIFGSFFLLGKDHAETFKKWSEQYGELYEVYLGSNKIWVVNSMRLTQKLFLHRSHSLIDRPTFHTFHGILSKTSGYTLGTSPWSDRTKSARKAAATALNKPAVQSYVPLIDSEVTRLVHQLYETSKQGTQSFDPLETVQNFSLRVSLKFTYGVNLDDLEPALVAEIFKVEKGFGKNMADHVPLARLIPKDMSMALNVRQRRDAYTSKLLDGLQQSMEKNLDEPCIVGNILKDPEERFTQAQLTTICLSMIAGSDTVPANLVWLLGLLAKHPEIQEAAYEDLIKVHGGESWGDPMKEDVPYIVALVKETLRYFTVGRLAFPRKAVQDIVVDDSTIIPTGSMVFLNAWAVDRDPEQFKDPSKFEPRRYLDTALASSSIAHVAYGAGSRNCIGNHLANRELYVVLCRLLWSFKFFPAEDYDIDPLTGVIEPNVLVVYPRGYKIRMEVRDTKLFELVTSK